METTPNRFFLITIDTEGDNLWSAPRNVTTRNAEFLPRFQSLCESFGFKPVYLTDYRMMRSPAFQEFGRDIISRSAAEIGMHLHAWDTPPLSPLTNDDIRYQPYLIEFPEQVMREKIHILTSELEQTFGVRMRSHRAGRWALNAAYARLLAEKGYCVDCSVTPHVSWRHIKGAPSGAGGSDFTSFPDAPYFMDLNDISKAGDSALLEAPMTVDPPPAWQKALFAPFPRRSIPWRALNRIITYERWMRPNGKNLNQMLDILRRAVREKRCYVEFMLHSSELMPGGSPRFPTGDDVEKLYRDMEQLFVAAKKDFQGATLTEFYRWFSEDKKVHEAG